MDSSTSRVVTNKKVWRTENSSTRVVSTRVVLPDWCCWTLANIATPWPRYYLRSRSGALKFWWRWLCWRATTTASVSVRTCYEQRWFLLPSPRGVNYMTRVTLLPSFTSLDWRERHLTACSMLWFLPVTQCAGDAGGGRGHFRQMGCWDFYFVIWVVRWQWSGFVWFLGSPPRPALVF